MASGVVAKNETGNGKHLSRSFFEGSKGPIGKVLLRNSTSLCISELSWNIRSSLSILGHW